LHSNYFVNQHNVQRPLYVGNRLPAYVNFLQ
jgi:hypothetical protein